MASVGKYDKSSPFWYAAFTDPLGRRLKKSTGQTSKSRALEMARTWEKASEEASQVRLTEARAREVISELMRSVGGESLTVFTVEQWSDRPVNQKKKDARCAEKRRANNGFRPVPVQSASQHCSDYAGDVAVSGPPTRLLTRDRPVNPMSRSCRLPSIAHCGKGMCRSIMSGRRTTEG